MLLETRVESAAALLSSWFPLGAIAQLVERFHGMEEVRSSILLSSTSWLMRGRMRVCLLPERVAVPAPRVQRLGSRAWLARNRRSLGLPPRLSLRRQRTESPPTRTHRFRLRMAWRRKHRAAVPQRRQAVPACVASMGLIRSGSVPRAAERKPDGLPVPVSAWPDCTRCRSSAYSAEARKPSTACTSGRSLVAAANTVQVTAPGSPPSAGGHRKTSTASGEDPP